MRLRYTILYVANVPAAQAFYSAAFGLEVKMLHESGGYGEMSTGNTLLAFAERGSLTVTSKSVTAPDSQRPTFEIAFETDDVEGAYAKAVAAGAEAVAEPAEMPWGQVVGHVSDPDGFLVEICSPINPV